MLIIYYLPAFNQYRERYTGENDFTSDSFLFIDIGTIACMF